MSEKLPRLTASDVIGAIEKAGFLFARQTGSHKIYKNDVNSRVTVPFHSGRILHPKVLRNIMKDAELTIEDLKELLK